MRAVRDVAQLVLISGADWKVVVDRAQRDGIGLVIAGGVHAAWTELGLDHQHPLVKWGSVRARLCPGTRLFVGYTVVRGQGWAPEGLSVLGALGPIDRAAFLAGLAVPSRASMRARNRTWSEHVRLGASALRRR